MGFNNPTINALALKKRGGGVGLIHRRLPLILVENITQRFTRFLIRGYITCGIVATAFGVHIVESRFIYIFIYLLTYCLTYLLSYVLTYSFIYL